jgi:hypothetical protein
MYQRGFDMALQGSTQDFSTIQVFNLVRLALRTGKLTFSGKIAVDLFFNDGQLIYARKQTEKPDLLQILVAAGKLAESESQYIREKAADVDDRWLSRWLLEAGYITKQDLGQSVHRQVLHTVYETILYADGDFSFDDGVLPSLDVPITAVELRPIIDEGDRLLKNWEAVQTAVPSLNIYLQPTAQLTPSAGRMLLTKSEWQVGSACNGHRTANEIAQTLNMDDFQMRRIVYNLLNGGMIQIVNNAPEPPSENSNTPGQPPIFEAAIQTLRSNLQQQLSFSW